MTEIINHIPARLKNAAVGGHVAGASDIIDDTLNKTQDVINDEVAEDISHLKESLSDNLAYLEDDDSSAVIADFDPQADTVWKKQQTLSSAEKTQVQHNIGVYGRSQTYTKTEVNGLVSTPHQNYVTVSATSQTSAATDVLPASGQSADTIYRVSNWDGNAGSYDVTKYSEYAWDDVSNPNKYVFLRIETQIGEVFDISVYNNNAEYDDLEDALGTNGANVPESVRRGGMSVKFVQSSDHKYIRYNLITDEFTTDVTKWAIAEEGVYVENPEFVYVKTDAEDKILWAIRTDGDIFYGAGVPSQVVNYINEKIAELSLDEYEDIVAFLSGLEEGDKTLQMLLNEKVDKEEGKSLINAEYASSKSTVDNPEFLDVTTDSEGKLLAGRTPDGAAFENVGFSTPKVSIDGHIIENIEDPEGRSEITADSEGKIISYRDSDGVKHEEVGIDSAAVNTNSLKLSDEGMSEFQQALKESGFQPGGHRDWSDYISNKGKNPLHLSVPRLAYINLTNTSGNLSWPQSKTDDLEAIMEFNDMQGNYFKKNIIFNAQGSSSMAFIKKNGSIKMFDDSVYNSKGKKGKGDKFGVKFGDWVPQSTYHIKAYYTDFFKGVSYIAYQIALEVANTRGIFKDRTWKQGLFKDYTFTDNLFENPQINDMNIQIDNGALCQPDGFPCIVYLNGEFYGIYVWLIKKDAANFNMEDKAEHIHLDGRLDNNSIFGANGNAENMNWNPASDSGFEVRNPEDLITMEGEAYDADINKNQELAGIRTIDEVIPIYNNATSYVKGAIVKSNNRVYLSKVNDNVGNNPDDAKSTDHTKSLDKATDFWIDVTFDNKVKTYILELSAYRTKINSAPTAQDKKELFEQYFDINNQIDYELVQMAVADGDGFSKNWQWTTWDGTKWFVNNYDKDCSFGNNPTGMLTTSAPDTISSWDRGWTWITAFLVDNYNTELKQRWSELVAAGIFTKDYIINLFKNWVQRIGAVNYNKEYTKWTEAPCNRDSGINTEYWEIGTFVYTTNPQTTYDSTVNYIIGDTCIIGNNNYEITFTCKKDCIGQNPITTVYSFNPFILGYRDNLWRVAKFIEKNLNSINTFVNN